ncbi:hypothetical protein M0802_016983 [Mischocyttarus mexicanus]|nr:hypothetical protein M0802_016983 [Mischocyttarus mexicanus]
MQRRRREEEEEEEGGRDARLLPYCGGFKPLTYCRPVRAPVYAGTMDGINGLMFYGTKALDFLLRFHHHHQTITITTTITIIIIPSSTTAHACNPDFSNLLTKVLRYLFPSCSLIGP